MDSGFWFEAGALLPSIGAGLLFWFVIRSLLRADRREREAARAEAALSSTPGAVAVFDLDGTVWSGGEAIPHAVEAIEASGLRAMYVTNNASRSAADVAERLRDIGLAASEEDVLTSAMAALGLAKGRLEAGDPVLVVGAEGKGLSRMVREHCQQIVSIPIDSTMESLNASMAVGISLYEISVQRAGGR